MLPLQYPRKLDSLPVAVLDRRSFETSQAHSSVPAIHTSLPAILTYQKDKCHRNRRVDGKVCLRDLTVPACLRLKRRSAEIKSHGSNAKVPAVAETSPVKTGAAAAAAWAGAAAAAGETGRVHSDGSDPVGRNTAPVCDTRQIQLRKLKKFFDTLQHVARELSTDIGEIVDSLISALLNSQITIEDFYFKLRKATNFPLKPFVIPFLQSSLPLMQKEQNQDAGRCSGSLRTSIRMYVRKPSIDGSVPGRNRLINIDPEDDLSQYSGCITGGVTADNRFLRCVTDDNRMLRGVTDDNRILHDVTYDNRFMHGVTDDNRFMRGVTDENGHAQPEGRLVRNNLDARVLRSVTDDNRFRRSVTYDNRILCNVTDGNRFLRSVTDDNRFRRSVTDNNRFLCSVTDDNRFLCSVTDDNRFRRSVTDGNRNDRFLRRIIDDTCDKRLMCNVTEDNRYNHFLRTVTNFRFLQNFSGCDNEEDQLIRGTLRTAPIAPGIQVDFGSPAHNEPHPNRLEAGWNKPDMASGRLNVDPGRPGVEVRCQTRIETELGDRTHPGARKRDFESCPIDGSSNGAWNSVAEMLEGISTMVTKCQRTLNSLERLTWGRKGTASFVHRRGSKVAAAAGNDAQEEGGRFESRLTF